MKTDFQIQNDVIEELRWEPLLNSAGIGVSVKNGIVTLSGIVDTYTMKRAAEKATKRVGGVKAVAEELIVDLPGSNRRDDVDIAEAALNALKWHSAMQENRISITVEDGFVTLEGEVDWEFQRASARMMIENLNGVWGIVNNIKLSRKATSKEVKHEIAAAFHRSATLDSGKIKIDVVGSKAILTGSVRSWPERDDAERAAWSAPGIERVENKLIIDTRVLVV